MAPSTFRKGVLGNLLANKKNTYNYQSSHIYHSFLFCCDRFRDVFKLPQFRCHDLDAALNLESENFRAGSKGLEVSDLIRKIVIALCKPFGRPCINHTNYNEVVHYVVEKHFVTEKRPNFLGNVESANVHALPSEVKIYLLNFLLDLRIRKDESETVDMYCDASALRVLKLGMDSFNNTYFYFGEFRVVAEMKEKQTYHHHVDESNLKNALWRKLYQELTENSQFLIVAENPEQWKNITEAFEAGSSSEKKMVRDLKILEKSEMKAYVEEMERRTLLKAEEMKAMRKNEIQLRKELGLVRSSGRLQVKEIERRTREEEERKAKEEKDRLALERAIANGTYVQDRGTQKTKTRAERHQHREAIIALSFVSESSQFDEYQEEKSITREIGYSLLTCEENDKNKKNHEKINGEGNESDKEANSKTAEQKEEEEPIGIEHAEESIDQQSHNEMPSENSKEVPIDHMDYVRKNDHSIVPDCSESSDTNGSFETDVHNQENGPPRKKKKVSFASYQPTRREGMPEYDPIPYLLRIDELKDLTMKDYYALFTPSKVKITQKDYVASLQTAFVLFQNEFQETQNNLRLRGEPWIELDRMLNHIMRDMLETRIELVMELETLVESSQGCEIRASLIKGMLVFAEMSWDHLFPEHSKEDRAAKAIIGQLLTHLG